MPPYRIKKGPFFLKTGTFWLLIVILKNPFSLIKQHFFVFVRSCMCTTLVFEYPLPRFNCIPLCQILLQLPLILNLFIQACSPKACLSKNLPYRLTNKYYITEYIPRNQSTWHLYCNCDFVQIFCALINLYKWVQIPYCHMVLDFSLQLIQKIMTSVYFLDIEMLI